jgi:hypothetical protein
MAHCERFENERERFENEQREWAKSGVRKRPSLAVTKSLIRRQLALIRWQLDRV